MRNDEGLYAYDVISNPYRLMRTLNIKNYGDGSLGDVTNPTAPLNNYAKVTAISTDGKTITYSNKTATGMAPIAAGASIIFHVSKHTDSADMSLLGKFILAKVLSDDGTNLILDTAITSIFDVAKLSKYSCQIISVAQFNSLTISTNYAATKAWDDTNKIGGICAIAAKSMIDITGGQINVEIKGGGTPYARAGLAFIGNAQMADILPLGQGHGSVFLLTSNLKTNSLSRIGATYSGVGPTSYFAGGGYINSARGYGGSKYGDVNYSGSGAQGYQGYGSNGYPNSWGGDGSQGSHIVIIADSIVNLNIVTISTGGKSWSDAGGNGGAGYGGGGMDGGGSSGYCESSTGIGGFSGGYNGGGGGESLMNGGSSGWAFIYANSVSNEDYNRGGDINARYKYNAIWDRYIPNAQTSDNYRQ